MLDDTKHQKEVVTCLLEISSDFWNQCLQSNTFSSKTPAAAVGGKTPPYNPNYVDNRTPKTPECKEPLETKLGSVDPRSHAKSAKRYNAMTPKVVSKDGRRQRHFFNSPS